MSIDCLCKSNTKTGHISFELHRLLETAKFISFRAVFIGRSKTRFFLASKKTDFDLNDKKKLLIENSLWISANLFWLLCSGSFRLQQFYCTQGSALQ